MENLFIHGAQTGTTSLGQSRPRSNDNERVFHTPYNFRTGTSPLVAIKAKPKTLGGVAYPTAVDAVDIF